MAIDEFADSIPDRAIAQPVSLSRWVNEGFPSCQAVLTDHEVARLTRRPRWVLEALTFFRRFPKKQRFHGRRIGWRRQDVLLWLGSDEGCVDTAPVTSFTSEPEQRELQLRHPPCRRSRSHRSHCSSGRYEQLERLRMRQSCSVAGPRNSDSTVPDQRKWTSDRASETP